MQSSASPDPVSPVERELDRFPCLLKPNGGLWAAQSLSAPGGGKLIELGNRA